MPVDQVRQSVPTVVGDSAGLIFRLQSFDALEPEGHLRRGCSAPFLNGKLTPRQLAHSSHKMASGVYWRDWQGIDGGSA